jgi:hypothetical protein
VCVDLTVYINLTFSVNAVCLLIDREERLTRSKSHGLGEKEMSKIKLQALMIETLLFKQQQKKCPESSSSPCKDGSAANDVSIDLQLKTFLTRVQEHRKSLEKSSSTNHLSVQSSTAAVATSPAEHRTLVLRRILGDEQYTRARALMDDIQTVGRGCRLEPGRMPPAVRQLFFATKLVTVWSHTPVSLLEATTTAATWNTYIEQAEEHLRQYRAWVVCNNGSCC